MKDREVEACLAIETFREEKATREKEEEEMKEQAAQTTQEIRSGGTIKRVTKKVYK